MSRILALMLIFCCVSFGQNNKTLFVDETGQAVLRIFVTCEYKLVLKNPKDKELTIHVDQKGNGFFADNHAIYYDFVVSANHLFVCNTSLGELVSREVLADIDKGSDEDLSIDNIVAIKDRKINKISAFTFEGFPVENISVVFNTSSPKVLNDPDKALLRVVVSKDFLHTHIPLMDDKTFDSIFYKSGIGKEVAARGFLLYNNAWFLRYKNALIEWLGSDIFQINELLDNGLSGSPVVYFYEEKIYAVGVVSHGPVQQTSRTFDMSWVTIVKKSFLEKRNKK